MGEITAWVLCWRFESKPKSTFYNLLEDLIRQKKVDELAPRTVRCREEESAYQVRALVEAFDGHVQAFAANGRTLDDRTQSSRARIAVEQTRAARLSERGRRKSK